MPLRYYYIWQVFLSYLSPIPPAQREHEQSSRGDVARDQEGTGNAQTTKHTSD